MEKKNAGAAGLTFHTLAVANSVRVSQFKNKHGERAHAKADGSDWTPAQWLQAKFGEMGEFAEVRVLYEREKIDFEEYKAAACDELADDAIYHSLLSFRALDETTKPDDSDPAWLFMQVIAHLGRYANARKKFDRGDYNENELSEVMEDTIPAAIEILHGLRYNVQRPTQRVKRPDGNGVDLGRAVISKFNAVSDRVGASVYIDYDGDWYLANKGAEGGAE